MKFLKTKTCRDLSGRYAVKIHYIPDGGKHIISCIIRNYEPSSEDCIESGERLELYSFYYICPNHS